MQLNCPRCGDAVVGADIDLARGVGVCRPCGELVPFPSMPAMLSALASPPTTALYRPESFHFVEKGGGESSDAYEATIAPNRLATLPILFFTLFWDGFMIVWYTIAILGGIWPMAVFGLLHLGVAFFLTHKVFVGMLNTRRFAIAGGRIRFTNGPVPTGGTLDASLAEVDGFAVRTKTSSSRSGTTTSFAVVANLAGGSSKQLSLVLDDAPSAEFAVQRLNEVLGEAKARVPQLPYRS